MVACNNKIEQGENNVLFSLCVGCYLSEKKSFFITKTVNPQCPITSVKPAFRESRNFIELVLLNTYQSMIICWRDLLKKFEIPPARTFFF